MLALRGARSLLRPTARRSLLSTAATDAESFALESLALQDGEVLSPAVVTQRVLQYLQVDQKLINRVFKSHQPLHPKALFAPQYVERLTPLARWGFQHFKVDPLVTDAVFKALAPHANMAGVTVWRLFFQRQFFLSGAPLDAYMRAYKSHLNTMESAQAAEEEGEEKEEVEEEGDEELDEESSDPAKSKQTSTDTSKAKLAAVLAENKGWEWAPLSVTSTIVKEFCYRGRFAEAIEAYASLPLTNQARQNVASILHEYEQYPSVVYLYEVHRAMGSAVSPLDVVLEFDALKKLGRVEELDTRFQELPATEQARVDIQELMDN
ncbi:hypothetical protein P3T76_011024 [Phytophthora citrophthora]|uniref:Uncharacterized protein n=1 Tax=Phytophthora citrophthora TaxID=4793 RepID=A0AAD9LFA6_9STRA|nr:hypothetical protein P3T76_011024 [Phytophthora citrophthora]